MCIDLGHHLSCKALHWAQCVCRGYAQREWLSTDGQPSRHDFNLSFIFHVSQRVFYEWGSCTKIGIFMYLILKSPSVCLSFFLSFLSNFPELWLTKMLVSGRGSGIPLRGCVFLYSFSFLPQHIKGKSAQKIGMSIGTAVVNVIFPKWRNITA